MLNASPSKEAISIKINAVISTPTIIAIRATSKAFKKPVLCLALIIKTPIKKPIISTIHGARIMDKNAIKKSTMTTIRRAVPKTSINSTFSAFLTKFKPTPKNTAINIRLIINRIIQNNINSTTNNVVPNGDN